MRMRVDSSALHKLIAGHQTPSEARRRGLPAVDTSTLVSALEICWCFLMALGFLTWSLSFVSACSYDR